MDAQKPVQATVTSDILVYLFSEIFAEPAKGLLTQAMIAPQSGEKYNLKQVVISAYMAALMDLSKQGAIKLTPIEVRKMFGKETTLQVEVGHVNGDARSAFQNRLIQSASAARKPEEGRVREVVIRMNGGRSSSKMPWFVAVAALIGEAKQAGLVTTPEKSAGVVKTMFNPTEAVTRATAVTERVAALQSEAQALKSRIAAFEAELGPQGAALRKEIEKAIDECMDRSD